MIPETENPREAKSVYLVKPARHARTDTGRYFTLTLCYMRNISTQSPHCWFSRGTAQMLVPAILQTGYDPSRCHVTAKFHQICIIYLYELPVIKNVVKNVQLVHKELYFQPCRGFRPILPNWTDLRPVY